MSRIATLALIILALGPAEPALAQSAELDNSWVQEHLAELDTQFGNLVQLLAFFLFADLGTGVPLIVVVLLFGGIYYSFYFGWISLRGIRHSIDVIRGRYDNPDDPGTSSSCPSE